MSYFSHADYVKFLEEAKQERIEVTTWYEKQVDVPAVVRSWIDPMLAVLESDIQRYQRMVDGGEE